MSPIPDKWEIPGVLKTSECPRRLITDDVLTWLHYGRAYRDGHLWCAGGISDQPEVYLQAMQLIQTTLAKVQ